MPASLLAASRSNNHFESQLAQQMASNYNTPRSHNSRKRKSLLEAHHANYYESDTEPELDYQGLDPEDTIIAVSPSTKKRKVVEVIVIDDSDSDDDIPLAKLSPAKITPVVKIDAPKEDNGRAGGLFRELPTEVRAALSFAYRPILLAHIAYLAPIGSLSNILLQMAEHKSTPTFTFSNFVHHPTTCHLQPWMSIGTCWTHC